MTAKDPVTGIGILDPVSVDSSLVVNDLEEGGKYPRTAVKDPGRSTRFLSLVSMDLGLTSKDLGSTVKLKSHELRHQIEVLSLEASDLGMGVEY